MRISDWSSDVYSSDLLMSTLSGVDNLRLAKASSQSNDVLEFSTTKNSYQLLNLSTLQALDHLAQLPPETLIIDLLSGEQHRWDPQKIGRASGREGVCQYG